MTSHVPISPTDPVSASSADRAASRAPAPPAAQRPRLRVAYLNTEYPSLSHTFIEREIRAVRAAGVEVHPFSVRAAGDHGRLGGAHEAAAAETYCLLGDGGALAVDSLAQLGASPAGYARALALAQRLAMPGLRSRLVHNVYVAEAARLVREMRRRSLNHVHVHMANNGATVAMLACAMDRSLTYSLTIHGSAEFFHVDTWRLGPKAEGALFVRCISNFCRAQVMTWTRPEAWERFEVVHCGVDLDAYRPRPAREAGPLRLLTVGRLHPIKGYGLLFEALARLDREGVAWELDMVGDGPMRADLEQRAGAMGLAHKIKFSGAVGQDVIQTHFDRADAMVISSFMEGVPVVLMEAMAKELAVVATRVGGIPELVEDGVSGVLVDAGSAPALARGLQRLASDPELRATAGREGRRRVSDGFSLDKVGPKMADLLERYCPAASAR